MSRSKTSFKRRRPRVSTDGMPDPTRDGWKALLDIDPEHFAIIQWILKCHERNRKMTAIALAREIGIRPETARLILTPSSTTAPPWESWARDVMDSGSPLCGEKSPLVQVLNDSGEETGGQFGITPKITISPTRRPR